MVTLVTKTVQKSTQVFTYSVCYFWLISTKIRMHRKMLVKISSIQFHEKLAGRCWTVPRGEPARQTDMMRLVSHSLCDCLWNTPHNRIRQKQRSANCRFNALWTKNGFWLTSKTKANELSHDSISLISLGTPQICPPTLHRWVKKNWWWKHLQS